MYETNFILKVTPNHNGYGVTANVKLNKTIRGAKFFELFFCSPYSSDVIIMSVGCNLFDEAKKQNIKQGELTLLNPDSLRSNKNQTIRKMKIKDSKSTINEFEVVAQILRLPPKYHNTNFLDTVRERISKSYFQIIIYHTED